MIAIIDYDAGNLTSVARALTHLGYKNEITAAAETILAADRVIFPVSVPQKPRCKPYRNADSIRS